MNAAILTGRQVRLAALDLENDTGAYDEWSRDAEFLRLGDIGVARPMSAARARQSLEEYVGKDEPRLGLYYFSIRALADDRLLGQVNLGTDNWAQREAWLGVALGRRADWGKGYGSDAIEVALRFAFDELNLARVSLMVVEYNPRAIRAYLKLGFVEEGRLRGFLRRGGRRWDLVYMGLLRDEARAGQAGSDA